MFGVTIWAVRFNIISINILRLNPFSKNEDIHPTEEGKDEDDLWDEFEDKVQGFLEVKGVKAFHDDTKRHLENSNDNCDFHL